LLAEDTCVVRSDGRHRHRSSRLARILRRCLTLRSLAVGAVLLVSFTVVMAALTSRPSRTAGPRTEPVLRALRATPEGTAPQAVIRLPEPTPPSTPSPKPTAAEPQAQAIEPPAAPSPAAAPSSPPLPSVQEPATSAPPMQTLPTQNGPMQTAMVEPRLEVPPPPPTASPETALPSLEVLEVVPPPDVLPPPPEALPPPSPPAKAAPLPPLSGKPTPRPVAPPVAKVAGLVVPPLPPAARQRPLPGGAARLAIVIDDIGPAVELAHRAIRLPRPITLAFLPYAAGLDRLAGEAQAHGHEIYLHLPMEPQGHENPGPNAILTSLAPDEQRRRIAWAFDRLPQAVGVNNHMGSRATADPASMLLVLEEARRRGLMFVDSRTTPVSVGGALARRLGIPHASRDVFLDNDPSSQAILRQLDQAERLARRRGEALAIGHPYPTTLAVLASWLPRAEARGIKVVRAGDLIARRGCPEEPRTIPVAACIGAGCAPLPGC
jgi:polysaccharide deacetylase 2 family uncharacterized protein YibQ